jgi:hypothetical protein
MATVRFTAFPQTEPPPAFILKIIEAFGSCESAICTASLAKGLTSDRVLEYLRPSLVSLGFEVESGKHREGKINRPVFFGENGIPRLRYQIDAYHPNWKCALEIEAGRAWMGNAIYRDLIQALVMVEVNHLVLAVPNSYKYSSAGKSVTSHDYENTVAVARALYGHTRVKMPYSLTVVGY